MSKLFSEAECIAIVSAASGRPVCSPPAAKTESIQGLAALVDSGQAGGSLDLASSQVLFCSGALYERFSRQNRYLFSNLLSSGRRS